MGNWRLTTNEYDPSTPPTRSSTLPAAHPPPRNQSEDPLGIKRLPLHRVHRSLPSSNPINIRLVTMLSTVRRLSARRPSRRLEMALESPLTARRPSMPQISLSQTALARTAAVSSKKGRTSQVVRAETTDLAKVRDLASILIYTQRPDWFWAFPGASAAARPCTRGSVFRWEIRGKGAVEGTTTTAWRWFTPPIRFGLVKDRGSGGGGERGRGEREGEGERRSRPPLPGSQLLLLQSSRPPVLPSSPRLAPISRPLCAHLAPDHYCYFYDYDARRTTLYALLTTSIPLPTPDRPPSACRSREGSTPTLPPSSR